MQRRAYALGIALSATLLAGCTGGSGGPDDGGNAKPGSSDGTPDAAPPGKYRTLSDPCRAVDDATLTSLLPGAKDLDRTERAKLFAGEPKVTYDTDRRVGCTWKAPSERDEAIHRLRLDFERVVSYDPGVSDASRAEGLYTRRELAADLPAPSDPRRPESPAASPSPSAGKPSAGKSSAGKPSAGESSSGEPSAGAPSPGEPSATPPADGLEPRVLKDLGDDAFIDDELAEASRHRTVTVVFRTSNVLVTVAYDEQPTTLAEPPSSKNMQEKAQGLARKLSELFDE
ncbi:DUF3558 domain-containing protein [Streptomyces sp. NPDC060194]|uniref:DUF3558 domain-containing protein n=1 Tax=Streptomyces sp. NPDC060194 TaxID=3347069 RepID=UPI00365638B4